MNATSSRIVAPAYGQPGGDLAFCRRVAAGRRRNLLAGAAVATLALVTSGCTTTRPVVPPQLLTCAPQPPAPTAGTQRDVALYVVDLAAAGDDCRTKLGSVRNILEPIK